MDESSSNKKSVLVIEYELGDPKNLDAFPGGIEARWTALHEHSGTPHKGSGRRAVSQICGAPLKNPEAQRSVPVERYHHLYFFIINICCTNPIIQLQTQSRKMKGVSRRTRTQLNTVSLLNKKNQKGNFRGWSMISRGW